MDNDWLQNEFTDEEKALLEKINAKIIEKTKELADNKYKDIDNDEPLDLSSMHPEIIPPVYATDAPHEIKFSILGEISSIDDKGYIKDAKQMVAQNYFIPVIAGEDYMKYVNRFFEVFKTKLTETCQEILPKPNL